MARKTNVSILFGPPCSPLYWILAFRLSCRSVWRWKEPYFALNSAAIDNGSRICHCQSSACDGLAWESSVGCGFELTVSDPVAHTGIVPRLFATSARRLPSVPFHKYPPARERTVLELKPSEHMSQMHPRNRTLSCGFSGNRLIDHWKPTGGVLALGSWCQRKPHRRQTWSVMN